MPMQFTQYTLHAIPGKGSIMTPVDFKDYPIDFEVKRVYFITKPTGDTGQHCHHEEKELFILIQGTCIAVIDRGDGKEDIPMVGPTNAIYVPNYVWHGFKNFSKDAVLLALSSTHYRADRSDYLEDYEKYLTIRDEKLQQNQ